MKQSVTFGLIYLDLKWSSDGIPYKSNSTKNLIKKRKQTNVWPNYYWWIRQSIYGSNAAYKWKLYNVSAIWCNPTVLLP